MILSGKNFLLQLCLLISIFMQKHFKEILIGIFLQRMIFPTFLNDSASYFARGHRWNQTPLFLPCNLYFYIPLGWNS
jgi:hypothetical protein